MGSETERGESYTGVSMLLPLLVSLFCSSWGEASLQHVGEKVSKQTGEVSNLCPDHWIDATLSGLGCLFFNSSTTATWDEASSWCQHADNNASLLEIWSELQLDFVRQELMFLQDNGVDQDWWTGGSDQGREGRWYWSGSLAAVADFVWRSGEPSPNGGTRYNCLYLNNGDAFFGYDNNCYSFSGYFICQKK